MIKIINKFCLKQRIRQILVSTIISLCFFNININTKETNQIQQEKINNTEVDKINSLFSKTLALSEELGSIIQYIGQATNINKIKPKNELVTKEWINKVLKDINNIQDVPVKITLSYIFKLNLAIYYLSKQAKTNIATNFSQIDYAQLQALNLDDFQTNKYDISIESLESAVQENQKELDLLKNQTYLAGLTTVNKVARILDQINDRYGVLSKITGGVVAAGFATAFIYCLDNTIPKTPIQNNKLKWLINPIIKYKNFLGEKPVYYKQGDAIPQGKKIDDLANENQLGLIGKVDNLIFRNSDVQKVISIGGIAGGYYFGDTLKNLSDQIKAHAKNKWEQLKGYDNFTVGSQNRSYKIEESLNLSDERLIGLEEQAEELKKVAYYVVEPDIYDKQGVSVGKGILLTGPTRTGKTMLARALSGEINKMLNEKGSTKKFTFREIKFGELVWKDNAIQNLLEDAKKNAPCILFIDEIHNLPLQTTGFNKTLNEFLTGMSGINSQSDSKHQIIMLAATNKPELLDSALLQPGRFGTVIHFDRPHYNNRKKYFETMLKRNMFNPEEFDLDNIAQQTQNCSYGDLEEILREARFNARRESKRLNQKHLQDKINTHVHRFKTVLPLGKKEIDIVASYQAGKVLTSNIFNASTEILAVTILGREPKLKEQHRFNNYMELKEHEANKQIKYGHIVKYNPQESLQAKDIEDYIKEAKILISGHIAQSILLDNIYLSYRPEDKHKAFENIKKYLLKNIEEKELSKQEKETLKAQVLKIIKEYEKEVTQILLENKTKLEKLYLKLKSNITLSQKDIKKIV